jgi:hypothetical protein
MAEIPTQTGTTSTKTMPNRRYADGELRDRLGVGRGSPGTDNHSKRAKITETVKTLLWVIPLTILIWVYAEREQLQKDEEVSRVAIKLKSTATDRMVMLDNPAETVTLFLNGPKAGINKVREELSETGLPVEVSDDLRVPFDGEILLSERIARNSLFANKAVTVVRTKPATVKIKADKKRTVSAKVQMRPDDRVNITDCKFTPEEVKVDVPDSVAGPTTRPDALPIYADLKALIDKGQGTRSDKVPVVFGVDQGSNLAKWSIPTQYVTATVTINAAKQLQLKSVPVVARIHAFLLEKDDYYYAFDQKMVRDVTVTGPAKAIDELERRTLKTDKPPVTAVIDITPDDLNKISNSEGDLKKTLEAGSFAMPADLAKDLTVTSPLGEIINIKVTKKG